MPTNTKYNPKNIFEFEKTKLYINAQGVSGNVENGQSGNIDYLLTDDCLLTGITLISSTSNYGHYVNFQVVDTSGAFSGVPGTVILQPATSWYIAPGSQNTVNADYPAKLPAGLTIRIIYVNTSTGEGNTNVYVNYRLHKVLV